MEAVVRRFFRESKNAGLSTAAPGGEAVAEAVLMGRQTGEKKSHVAAALAQRERATELFS